MGPNPALAAPLSHHSDIKIYQKNNPILPLVSYGPQEIYSLLSHVVEIFSLSRVLFADSLVRRNTFASSLHALPFFSDSTNPAAPQRTFCPIPEYVTLSFPFRFARKWTEVKPTPQYLLHIWYSVYVFRYFPIYLEG